MANHPPDASPEPTSGKNTVRLLVVDDSETNRDMLSRRLEMRGYVTREAEDGPAALELLAAESFDLVLLDIMMPGVSGLEVLETLRKSSSMTELPVIMVTAKKESGDVVEALKLGANDYVTKPLDFPVVMARVRTQLELRRLSREVRKMADRLAVHNRFIRRTFGRYLTDEVVSSLLESPDGLEIGGQKRRLTILLADLRGFSSISEQLPAERVMTLLNTYLEAMTELIIDAGGTIDEFIGDAIMVIFGAPVARPDHALRAVACALRMQIKMDEVNRVNAAAGLPELAMGIGISTGEVIVGNIGSEKRSKYGVVGRHVNLASRIESFTVGDQVLISGPTRREIDVELRVDGRFQIHPKGFDHAVEVYEVGGLGGEIDLYLPRPESPTVPLPEPVGVRFMAVVDKNVIGTVFAGKILRLGRHDAELFCDPPPEPLQDLSLRMVGHEDAGSLYCKVLARKGPEKGCCLVRFTSVPPPIRQLIDELLSSASAA